jgi:hypothetical protein
MSSQSPDPLADQTRPMAPVSESGAAVGTASTAGTPVGTPVTSGAATGQQHAYGYGAPGYGQQPGTSGFPYGGTSYGHDHPTEAHQRPALAPSGTAQRGGAATAALLAFLVVVLGLPALVLTWRSAVGHDLAPSGLVGGLLAVTGLSVLAAGLFRLVARPDQGGGAAERLLRAPALLVIVGTVLLVGAAFAV